MAASVAVGLVLLVAGAAKLRQPEWPATAAAFGAPRWLSSTIPWVEVGLGALLVTAVGLPWTALAAAGLVTAFTAMVAVRLVLGHPVPCGCFGETSPRPVGVDTLARNLVLLGAAMAAALTSRHHGGPGSVAVGALGGAAFFAAARARAGARQ
ncbi:MAG TPA: MauE/DoxX family redox-associated membrane protein [Acidimicrobiales bacterium]|nr:MauE/DoxX family redox-associated membrane protein [Acidimicrobiales bacterium]